jgi:alginate O-acetyltransferase complex protein AlgI
MLFNSTSFLLLFLPVTLAAFYCATLVNQVLAKIVLIVASIVFYAIWKPVNLWVLLGSTVINYLLALGILAEHERGRPERRKLLLVIGLTVNLLLLGYFKYTSFLVETANDVFSLSITIHRIVLPLGISFFTFQKIAFLIDVYDRQVGKVSFLDYCLFVFFFPQLIAGPIVHHREIIPQLEKKSFGIKEEDFCTGATLLVIGLAKKVLIADTLAGTENAGFQALVQGNAMGIGSAWMTMLSATLQIYFDFSGYSDMAVGLALMFGIRLPLNFNSPFKASNLVELWARWHMSLTRFLTAYVYNPIVMSVSRRWAASGRALPKKGRVTIGAYFAIIAFPTVATMVLAGIWHGAGFQFLMFGFLNGLFMALCHGWRQLKQMRGWAANEPGYVRPLAVVVTFVVFTFTLVFFKAPSLKLGMQMVANMLGQHGMTANVDPLDVGLVSILLAVVWFLPNSQEIVGLSAPNSTRSVSLTDVRANLRRYLTWRPSVGWAMAMGALGFASLLVITAGRESPFLYFQF